MLACNFKITKMMQSLVGGIEMIKNIYLRWSNETFF